MLLANRFKERRIYLNMSQAEVADGICKQSQISRIEQGNYMPGADLLYALSDRLGVDINYFFNGKIVEKSAEFLEFSELSKKFLYNKNYEELEYIYNLEIKKNKKLRTKEELYIEWIEAILILERKGNIEKGREKLEQILSKINKKDDMYMIVVTSLLNAYYKLNVVEEYTRLYLEINDILNEKNIKYIDRLEEIIKVKYNYCYLLWKSNDTQNAIDKITELIEMCKSYKTTYLLADTYCLLGNVMEKFSSKAEVKKNFEIAYLLYEINNNKKMMLTIQNYLNDNYSEG
ncbi:MAG: helix-turn-helix transcriptional regulator [Gemella sp.]|nr:helix-turn-helix transcriptional regulator [Gemella sp.]